MRKLILCTVLIMCIALGGLFASQTINSTVRLSSIVRNQNSGNPSVIIGINSTSFNTLIDPSIETVAITDVNLTESGSFTFALMTSDDVYIGDAVSAFNMSIEIKAEGFHRYDYDYTGYLEGSSMDEANILERDAVPILKVAPEISIPQFQGENENVSVVKDGRDNVINVQFLHGKTRADLVLGTFTIEWNGKRPLEAGNYKAKVSVTYSTP